MRMRAVLFDIYGTLLEVCPPAPDAEARWRELLQRLPGPAPSLSIIEFATACDRVVAHLHEAARAQAVPWPEVQWPSVVSQVLPAFARLTPAQQEAFVFDQVQTIHTTRLLAETADLLRWLRRRPLRLGLISNAQAYTRRELAEALLPYGLGLDLFEADLCFWSFEHGFSKPDPHVFRILTARLEARGVSPNEILMVGDRLDNDICPARESGWQAWQCQPPPDVGWTGLRHWLEPRSLATLSPS